MMSNMINELVALIDRAIQQVTEWITTIIEAREIEYFEDIVSYFKHLNLDPNKHTPFIADARKLKDMGEIEDSLDSLLKDECIFIGVYNAETDEIEHCKLLNADKIDDKTRQILGDETLVVLS